MNKTKTTSLLIWLTLTAICAWLLADYLAIPYLYGWVGAINALIFIAMGKDKFAAVSGLRRTPESTLFSLGLLGGFPGLFTSRWLFRHKNSKQSFTTTLWILLALQLGAGSWYLYNNPQDLSHFGLKRKQLTAPQPAENAQAAQTPTYMPAIIPSGPLPQKTLSTKNQ